MLKWNSNLVLAKTKLETSRFGTAVPRRFHYPRELRLLCIQFKIGPNIRAISHTIRKCAILHRAEFSYNL